MRLLCHLVARSGAESELRQRLGAESRALGSAAASRLQSCWMWRLPDDSFGPTTPYHGTLELRAEGGAERDRFPELLDGLADRLGDCMHADLSTALVGVDREFVAPKPTGVRYQYLMRRNAQFSHDSYLLRYAEIHSRFGVRTPGIQGYVQFHIDPELSRQAARSAGFGVCCVDSVSELHLDSLPEFMDAIAGSSIGEEAIADEERFVDRTNSFAFCSEVYR